MQIPNDNYTTAPDPHPVAPLPNTLPILPPRVNRSYADVTRGQNDNSQDITLSKFLEEFKQMFNQLIQQNSLVLNMLTTLISKLK